MASKSIRGLVITALILGVFFSAPTRPVQAASLSDLPLTQQTVKFYIDPGLVSDMDFARRVLPKYVADMNAILAKNTRRQLVFDPQTDIIAGTTRPPIGSAPAPLPTEGFEVWAYVAQTSNSTSYGGYMSVAASGAGVLAGLNWTRLYDPDQLSTTASLRDYSIQISNMLHELAHVFGAGIGEYYTLGSVTDTTGTSPLLNINVNNAGDPYWSDKPDLLVDPLLRVTWASTRSAYLQRVSYSSLTAAVMNGEYRNGIPSFGDFTVQVADRDGAPVPSAEVKVWSVDANMPNPSRLLYDVQTDDRGQATLAWGGIGNQHNSANLLRLIKVYDSNGRPLTEPRYISIFDLDIALLVKGDSSFVVTPQPANLPPTDITLSNAALDENQPAGTLVGELAAVDPDAAGETFTFRFCEAPDDESFNLDGSQLLTAVPLDYERHSSYNICIRADDGRGGTLDKTMSIQANDLPDVMAMSFTSTGANDGWVLESARGSDQGGSLKAGGNSFRVGSDANNRRYRSVVAFNTSGLPDNAFVTKVTLSFAQQGMSAANPFESLGELVVDMGRPLIGSSRMLQAGDFQAQAGMASAGVITFQMARHGWYTVDLSPSAYGLVNARGATQLRLEFSGTANVGAAYLSLYSGNAAAAYRPTLTIEYELP